MATSRSENWRSAANWRDRNGEAASGGASAGKGATTAAATASGPGWRGRNAGSGSRNSTGRHGDDTQKAIQARTAVVAPVPIRPAAPLSRRRASSTAAPTTTAHNNSPPAEGENSSQGEQSATQAPPTPPQRRDSPKAALAIAEGRRVYLGNLLYSAKPADVEALLESCGLGRGVYERIHISIDPFTGRNPSYCFVEFGTREDAERAMRDLEGRILLGRPVKSRPCLPKGSGEPWAAGGGGARGGDGSGSRGKSGGGHGQSHQRQRVDRGEAPSGGRGHSGSGTGTAARWERRTFERWGDWNGGSGGGGRPDDNAVSDRQGAGQDEGHAAGGERNEGTSLSPSQQAPPPSNEAVAETGGQDKGSSGSSPSAATTKRQGPHEALRRWEESWTNGTGGAGGTAGVPGRSKRLYVGGLPRMGGAETDANVRELFQGFEVEAISKLVSPDQSRRLRPGHNAHFCFVDFASPEQALAALRSVRGRRATVKGSAVRVNVAFGDNGRKKERDAAELEAWRMADAAATANGAEVTATTHPPPSASEQGRNEAAES